MANTLTTTPTSYISARELHARLGVGKDFTNWIKGRIDDYGFTAGEDFSPNLAKRSENVCSPDLASKGRGGHNRTDYELTYDMAKELAMIENNEQGRRIRRELIAAERTLRTEVPLQLNNQARQIEGLRQMLLAQRPEYQKALRLNGIDGLTQTEKAQLMGYKGADSWRRVLKEMAALGLIDYATNPQAGLANLARGRANVNARKIATTQAKAQALALSSPAA